MKIEIYDGNLCSSYCRSYGFDLEAGRVEAKCQQWLLFTH